MAGEDGRGPRMSLRGQLAVLVGIGAMFGVPAAQADTRIDQASGASDARGHAAEAVLIRLDGNAIQISDGGRAFETLPALNTPEAMRLRRLLEQRQQNGGAAVLQVNPMIVADGAGGGGWGVPQKAAKAAAQSHPQAQTAGGGAGDQPDTQIATQQNPADKKAK